MPFFSRIVLAILSRYCCHFLNWWRSTTRHPVFFCTQHNFWKFTCGLVLGCRPTDQVMTWGFVELGGFPVKLCIYCYICRADFRFFFPITYHLNSPSFSNCKGFLLLELFKLLLTGDRTICLNNNKNNDALGICFERVYQNHLIHMTVVMWLGWWTQDGEVKVTASLPQKSQ